MLRVSFVKAGVEFTDDLVLGQEACAVRVDALELGRDLVHDAHLRREGGREEEAVTLMSVTRLLQNLLRFLVKGKAVLQLGMSKPASKPHIRRELQGTRALVVRAGAMRRLALRTCGTPRSSIFLQWITRRI